ncbi:MAG: hypothetical protein JRN67_03980 [Nitrososphaerota archaeon]|nr:hypothetical protein [Nitrososphaerota archaeon]
MTKASTSGDGGTCVTFVIGLEDAVHSDNLKTNNLRIVFILQRIPRESSLRRHQAKILR